MKKLKNSIALFLLSLVIFQSGGFFMLFSIQQEVIKKQVKRQIIAGIPENELVVLKIPFEIENGNSSIFQRLEKNEFLYYGELYDVVRKEIIGETTWYYCFHDTRESAVNKRIQQTQKDALNNPLEKSKKTTITRLITSPYILSEVTEIPFLSVNIKFSPQYNCRYISWQTTPIAPPPKA